MGSDRGVIAIRTNSSNMTVPDSISSTIGPSTMLPVVRKLHTAILLLLCCFSLIPSCPAPHMKLDLCVPSLPTSAGANASYNNLSSICLHCCCCSCSCSCSSSSHCKKKHSLHSVGVCWGVSNIGCIWKWWYSPLFTPVCCTPLWLSIMKCYGYIKSFDKKLTFELPSIIWALNVFSFILSSFLIAF